MIFLTVLQLTIQVQLVPMESVEYVFNLIVYNIHNLDATEGA